MDGPSIPLHDPRRPKLAPDDATIGSALDLVRDLRVQELRDVERNPVGDLLRASIWGRITWNAAIGRPSSASLADGFVLDHWWWLVYAVAGPGGILTKNVRMPGDPGRFWELPADGSTIGVGFVCAWSSLENWIRPTLASGVSWTYPGLHVSPVTIVPMEQSAVQGDIVVMEFHVVEPIRIPDRVRIERP